LSVYVTFSSLREGEVPDSFVVESFFEIVESLVDEDEPELLHAENKKAMLAKKITGFMVFEFCDTKFRKALSQSKIISCNYKAKQLTISEKLSSYCFVFLVMFSKNDISRYYDLSEVHYRKTWDLDKSRSLHYGYWDDSVKNFHEALLNINKVLAEIAEIREGENILDAGCGVGGSSLWLAKEKNCIVKGISLNKRQVDKAKALANEIGVQGKVSFEQKDYANTFYPANSFDVVWAIESVCYADDKSDFLREATRVLKPGGRLIIADFFKKKDLNHDEANRVRKWAACWAINDFSTREEFDHKLKESGFHDIVWRNITDAIMPSAKKLYRSYFLGIIGAKFYQFFNPKATELGKNSVYSAYLQYNTLKKGLWKYQIVKAVKDH
jgi:cyclopropane fatty-acyl-phospholipid synthase-like methyltransferase